jgi:hypothetical protein
MRILISLPDDFLDEVDKICKKEERTRSQLIRMALKHYIKAEDLINSTIPKATDPAPANGCDMQFCKSASVGQFKIARNDNMGGTVDTLMNLCQFHKHKAESENSLK